MLLLYILINVIYDFDIVFVLEDFKAINNISKHLYVVLMSILYLDIK